MKISDTMKTGTIFKIQKFSIHDGPGIRTLVFFKGCPAHCWWCCNPESSYTSLDEKSELGKPREITVDELVDEIDKDRIFYDTSGGGVTFSGGEPLLQAEFLEAVLDKCKDERHLLHTAIETSGYAQRQAFLSIANKTDLILYDIKLMDNEEHKKYTGIANDLILENLRSFEDKSKVIIRFPVIPGITDTAKNIEQIKELMVSLKGTKGIGRIDLLPYHKFAEAKYEKLGLEYKLKGIAPPLQERMDELKKYFEEAGLKAKIGG